MNSILGKRSFFLVVVLLGVAILSSCMSTMGSTPPANSTSTSVASQATLPRDVYSGLARDTSLLVAMNGAKIDAVKKAVVDIIGAQVADRNVDKLRQSIYSTRNPNQFVLPETMETLRKDNVAPAGQPFMYVYELRIQVNRTALENTLNSLGLMPSASPVVQTTTNPSNPAQPPVNTRPSSTQPSTTQAAPVVNLSDLDLTAADVGTITPAQQRFIREYVDKLQIMVYSTSKNPNDARAMRAGVVQANAWLAENGYSTVDVETVEKLQRERALVYQAETGGQISLTQFIAQSVNADVYLELDAELSATPSGRNFLGKANLIIKIIDPNTGENLGSTPYTHPGQLSLSGEEDAKFQAMAASVWRAIPVAIDQAKKALARQLLRGVRYQLLIQNTPDRRTILDFQNKLRNVENVMSVRTLPGASDEAKLEIFYFGSGDDLELAIFDTAAIVSGLNNMDWVSSRGKLLTFTSGM